MLKGIFPIGVTRTADFTDCAVTGASTTKLSTVVDNLQVQLIPEDRVFLDRLRSV